MKTFILTGGIASGKSTTAQFFAAMGCKIIDTDVLANQIIQKKTTAWKEIINHFGSYILQPDHQINKKTLGKIIFNDIKQRKKLNKILHPRIINAIHKKIKHTKSNNPKGLTIIDLPLFFETTKKHETKNVILVYVNEYIQIKRLMKRNQYKKSDALARIKSQISMEKKYKMASIIINNSETLEKTKAKSISIFKKLISNQ